MSRFKPGDTVAFSKKFSRCGHIVAVDGDRGYRINTGKDIIYGYSNELSLISASAPIRPMEAMKKIDDSCKSMPEYTPDLRQAIEDFIKKGSSSAKLFASYIIEVSNEVIRACITAISNSRVDSIAPSINFSIFSWQLS